MEAQDLLREKVDQYDALWYMGHQETVDQWDIFVKDVLQNGERPSIEESAIDNIYDIHDKIHLAMETQDLSDEQTLFVGIARLALREAIRLDGTPRPGVTDAVDEETAADIYEHQVVEEIRDLMVTKNREYGSSWSVMRSSDIIGIIHVKAHRATELLTEIDNPKYESLEDSFRDIFNYCVFAMMRLDMEPVK